MNLSIRSMGWAVGKTVVRWATYASVFGFGLVFRDAMRDWTMLGRETASGDQVEVALNSAGDLLIIDRRTHTYMSYDREVTRSVVNMYTAFLSSASRPNSSPE